MNIEKERVFPNKHGKSSRNMDWCGMKKVVLIGVLFWAATMFGGCGRGDAEKSVGKSQEPRQQVAEVDAKTDVEAGPELRSSRDVVERWLAKKEISEGVDVDTGRILAVSTRGFSLKGEERDESYELKETYDFPDDENDDFETKRFKAVWKAYADGLATVSQMVAEQIDDETAEDKTGNGNVTMSLQSATQFRLAGVVTVTSVESLNKNGEYEFTVAVCQSNKRQELYKNSLIGDQPGRPGRHSLKEWIDENSSTGLICPQSFIDNEGVWWRVAGVPVEIGSTGKASARAMGRAKYYAFEAAIRTIWVDVDASMSVSTVYKSGDEKHMENVSRQVSIKPICSASFNDPFRVKWLESDKIASITGKPIRLVVCAIRDDAGGREESDAFHVEMINKNQKEAYERGRREALKEASKRANGIDP
jgi:hypothetical protein